MRCLWLLDDRTNHGDGRACIAGMGLRARRPVAGDPSTRLAHCVFRRSTLETPRGSTAAGAVRPAGIRCALRGSRRCRVVAASRSRQVGGQPLILLMRDGRFLDDNLTLGQGHPRGRAPGRAAGRHHPPRTAGVVIIERNGELSVLRGVHADSGLPSDAQRGGKQRIALTAAGSPFRARAVAPTSVRGSLRSSVGPVACPPVP